ncbi:SAC3/GANP/Nin1/mts3/eIF-3 p25 family-domain-containing protein, partial [Cryomyces antarcticus]
LKKQRERERADAIAQGFLADPDRPRTLAEAITPVGTCQDMCSEFERLERIVQKYVWGPEVDPRSLDSGPLKQIPAEERMVKKFRRAAAGIDEQLPSDLRPPAVLLKTCNYLFDDLIGNAESLASVHHFVWDRTRAIRNDFSIQQITKLPELRIAIECYERIARFHILSLHQLALPEKPYDKYDWFQEREQLDRTLLSLMQYYDDSRDRLRSPNEAEFRAYCVIFQIQDPVPDLEDRVQSWPIHIVRDGRVQQALSLYAAAANTSDVQGPLKPRTAHPIAQANWQRFWATIESNRVSYLTACVSEIYFNLVRRTALNTLRRGYKQGGSSINEDWALEELVAVLGFDDEEQAEDFCEHYGFSFGEREDGTPYIDLGS